MQEIEELRAEVNKTDAKLKKLLKERKRLAEEIGKLKKRKNIPIVDEKREKEILSSIDDNFEKEIFKKILSESRKLQF